VCNKPTIIQPWCNLDQQQPPFHPASHPREQVRLHLPWQSGNRDTAAIIRVGCSTQPRGGEAADEIGTNIFAACPLSF